MAVIFGIFVFITGSCVGSFVNVVIHRLPRGMSIVSPGSHCPKCRQRIAWYDNIPLLSWLLLGRCCRHCGKSISGVYPLVELITGAVFTLVFVAYMVVGVRVDFPTIAAELGVNDWAILGLHLWLVGALLAASGIDLERSIIPLSITSLTVGVAVLIHGFFPHPVLGQISSKTGGLAVGGCVGLMVSAVLLSVGVFKPTFRGTGEDGFVRGPRRRRNKHRRARPAEAGGTGQGEGEVKARGEILHEILYLGPPVVLAVVGWVIVSGDTWLGSGWQGAMCNAHVNAAVSSLFGMLIGGAVVWATRILGTLAFGREAMGLGDVHLMAAAGAALGWLGPTLAFFIAPFFGLLAALMTAVRRGRGELPYGPWLSLGLLTVMLFQDRIWAYLAPGLEGVWHLLAG